FQNADRENIAGAWGLIAFLADYDRALLKKFISYLDGGSSALDAWAFAYGPVEKELNAKYSDWLASHQQLFTTQRGHWRSFDQTIYGGSNGQVFACACALGKVSSLSARVDPSTGVGGLTFYTPHLTYAAGP